MGEVFLDAFLDTLIILPFLLVMNFLIELLEYGSKGFKVNKALNGGLAPLIGTAVGIVPQCGFSVVATEMYSKRKISLGALLAVYIATSDEALPIMLSSYAGIVKILPILAVKIVFALVVGYSVFGVQTALARKSKNSARPSAEAAETTAHYDEHVRADGHDCGEHDCDEHADDRDREESDDVCAHIHGCHRHSLDPDKEKLGENATKKQKAARVFSLYLKHPLIHTATVIFYIFAVNVAFGIAVYYAGEERLISFIGSTGYLQPLLAGAVGLIPNCAASVVITELYVVGGLNFGGAVAGLSVGAGIGYAVLIRGNRPIKNTVFIIVFMYVVSVAVGIAVNAVAAAI